MFWTSSIIVQEKYNTHLIRCAYIYVVSTSHMLNSKRLDLDMFSIIALFDLVQFWYHHLWNEQKVLALYYIMLWWKWQRWYFALNESAHSNPRWRALAHVFKKTILTTLLGSVQIKPDSISIMLLRTHHTRLQRFLQCFCWDFVKGCGINFLVCYVQYDKHENE